MSQLFASQWAGTTVANLHRGAVLPAARVVVVAIPLIAVILYWLVARRRRHP